MSSYSKTYASDPQLWDADASFLLKCQYTDGTQAVILSGWHRRAMEFENPIVLPPLDDGENYRYCSIDAHTHREDPWSDIDRYELEVSLDGAHDGEISSLLDKLMAPTVAHALMASMPEMIQRVSANKTNVPLQIDDDTRIRYVDLLTQNLPARSGDTSEPLRALHRWCRIFDMGNGTVSIYQPVSPDQLDNLRWPHNGIWLNRGQAYFTELSDVGNIVEAFSIPIKYEQYNLENWRIEFEFWENEPFQIMISDDSEEATQRLGRAQREIGVLSQFVTTAFLVSRNLERRSKVNELVTGNEALQGLATRKVAELKATIEEYRRLLERASGLLANTAQSVQAVANQENAEAAQRTNTFLTFASAVFFVPTLIISFFSMSIIGLNQGETLPSLWFVLALCLASVVVAIGVLVVLRRQLRKSRHKAPRRR